MERKDNTLSYLYRFVTIFICFRTNTNKYPSVSESYPDVTFTFNLQRNSPSYR